MQFSNHQVTVFPTVLFVDATRALTVYADARVRRLRTLLNFPVWNFSAWRHIILKYYNCHYFKFHATMQSSGVVSIGRRFHLSYLTLFNVIYDYCCSIYLHGCHA